MDFLEILVETGRADSADLLRVATEAPHKLPRTAAISLLEKLGKLDDGTCYRLLAAVDDGQIVKPRDVTRCLYLLDLLLVLAERRHSRAISALTDLIQEEQRWTFPLMTLAMKVEPTLRAERWPEFATWKRHFLARLNSPI